MARRSGLGGLLDSVKGLFGSAAAATPSAEPSPSAAEVSRAAYVADAAFKENRWRAALQTLDAVGAGRSTDPKALSLWIQCKTSLGESGPVPDAFRALLALPDASVDQLATAYGGIGQQAQLEFGPDYLARVDAAGLTGEARDRAMWAVPKALWPADRLFTQLAATNETHVYDELLALAKQRFPDDARLSQVKERPLDRFEVQRRANEEARKQREAKRAARASYDQAHKERRSAPGEMGAGLEAAVFASRDDVHAHRIYADWLQQHGDPRGELVMVQAERLQRPDDDALKSAEAAALQKAAPALLGSLAALEATKATFRLGFLHAMRLAVGYDDDLGDEDVVSYFLELDEARWVRELTIGNVGADGQLDFADAIEALVQAADRLPSLESLFIGDFDSEECELSWSELGDASLLYAAFPKLRALKLRAGLMELGKIELPELERFAIETGGLTQANLAAVANARWPRLRSLSLWFGQEDYGGDCTVDDVKPLLERSDLKLTHLGLANAEFTDELVPLLMKSPLLPGLETLDLSLGCLTGTGARVLADNRARLSHLKRLDLSRNCMSDADVELVRGLCAEVLVDDQEEERVTEGNRYSAVGE